MEVKKYTAKIPLVKSEITNYLESNKKKTLFQNLPRTMTAVLRKKITFRMSSVLINKDEMIKEFSIPLKIFGKTTN